MIEKKSNKERKRNIFLKNNSKKKIPSPGAERIDLFRLSLPPSCFSHRTDQRAQHPSCFLLPFFGPGERERERGGKKKRKKKLRLWFACFSKPTHVRSSSNFFLSLRLCSYRPPQSQSIESTSPSLTRKGIKTHEDV